MAWHCHQQRLAVCDGADSVQIFDLAGAARAGSATADLNSPQPSATLHHGDQKQVTAPSLCNAVACSLPSAPLISDKRYNLSLHIYEQPCLIDFRIIEGVDQKSLQSRDRSLGLQDTR